MYLLTCHLHSDLYRKRTYRQHWSQYPHFYWYYLQHSGNLQIVSCKKWNHVWQFTVIPFDLTRGTHDNSRIPIISISLCSSMMGGIGRLLYHDHTNCLGMWGKYSIVNHWQVLLWPYIQIKLISWEWGPLYVVGAKKLLSVTVSWLQHLKVNYQNKSYFGVNKLLQNTAYERINVFRVHHWVQVKHLK